MKVFITGGTSGIGFSLVEKYLNEGWQVGVCSRTFNENTFKFKHERLKVYQVDVTDIDKLRSAVNHFSEGKLDIMIANAGRSVGPKTINLNYLAAIDVININIIGVINSFQVALEIMKNSNSNSNLNGNGQLVAIASVAGMVGLPGAASYSASKAAVIKFCESMTLDLAASNIAVTTIMPGFIDTPLTKKNNHKMPFIMSSKKAADLIYLAIKGKKIQYIFPWQMKWVMIILEKMPRFIYRFIMSIKAFNYSSDL